MDTACLVIKEEIQPQDMMDMPEPDLKRKRSLINGTKTDMCGLCHVEELGAKPCVGLVCRHVYHAECVDGRIRGRSSRRITVAHLNCPVCKEEFELNAAQAPRKLLELLTSCLSEKLQIMQTALEIYSQDNLESEATQEYKPFPFKFMMEKMTLYNCNDCNRVYNGGKNDFDGALRENMEAKNFLCQQCAEKALGYG